MTLRPSDLEMFARYRIDADLLEPKRVERVTDEEARQYLGTKRAGDMSGLAFHYLSPHTGQRVTTRVRRDHPDVEDGKEKNKYIQAFGDGSYLYWPPGSKELLANPETYVVLVEAEKSCLALASYARHRSDVRLLPVGMGGAFGWKGKAKEPRRDGKLHEVSGFARGLELLNNQRRVIVLLDANVMHNSAVQAAERGLCQRLLTQHACPEIARLPQVEGVNGPDDLLAVVGDDAIEGVLAGAIPFGEAQQHDPTRGLVPVSEIAPMAVTWLWQGRIAMGTITMFDGDPGRGKGLTVVDLAARVSTGRDMPDGSPGLKGNVLYLTTEDAVSFVVRPRLDVAGANCEHVYMFDPNADELISLPEDCSRLEAMIRALSIRVVIIDPLSAFLGKDIDSHRDQDVRRALGPLHRVAERTGCAMIGIRHLTKAPGRPAMYRGLSSIGIIGQARAGFIFGAHPEGDESDDVRVMACAKINVGVTPPSMNYTVEGIPHPTLVDEENGAVRVGRIKWLGESDTKADALVSESNATEEKGQIDAACDFLRELFGDRKEVLSDEGEQAQKKAGLSRSTVYRARTKLKIESRKRADGSWVWFLTRPIRERA